MREKVTSIKYLFLTGLVLIGVVVPSIILPMSTAIAAAPDTRLIYDDTGNSAECRLELAIRAPDSIPVPTAMWDLMYNSSDASINDDYSTIGSKYDNRESLIFIRAVSLVDTDANKEICSFGDMLSRPSDPKTFLGFNASSGSLISATIDPAAKTLNFARGSHAVDTYKLTNDPDSGDALSNPIFTGTSGGVGYCSAEQAVGGAVYNLCARVYVEDFNTIRYRNETYTLERWEADNLEYYLSDTPYSAREYFLSQAKSCKPVIKFGTGNSQGASKGQEFDLNVDGDNMYAGVMDALNRIANKTETPNDQARIGYADFDFTCKAVGQVEVIAYDFSKVATMFQVFPKDKKIVFRTNNPGSNEKKFITGEFTQDANNPLRYNAPGRSNTCNTGDLVPFIILDNAPVETDNAPAISATWHFMLDPGSCTNGDMKEAKVLVKQTSASSTDTPATVGAETGVAPIEDGDTAETPAPITCNTTWKSAISWILCPIIGMAEELADKAKDVIASFLFIDINTFNGNADADTSNDNGLYNAWNSIRQVSTIIIVIIALIMIMSEAMGAGIMNNYSVKKILPKLIFAGIAIQLSWVFTKELINISNVFGNGVHGLMLAPFGGTVNTDLLTLIRPPDTDATSVGLSLALLVGGTVAIGAVGSAAIGLIIALVVAFVTLTLRYMVIILAVMFSPIAIAMSILPGTQKTYKLWWESFSKALLMYPIIMAMFAAGKIVAYGLMQSGTKVDANGTSQRGWFTLAAIIAYFLPYALLPAALKAGGTALNKVTGMFNDKSKGVFDKAKKYNERRSNVKKQLKQENWARNAGTGKGLNRLNPKAAYSRNRLRSAAGAPMLGAFPIGPGASKRRERYRSVVAGASSKANQQEVAEEKAQLQGSSDYSKKDRLLEIAQTGPPARARAAADRLVEMGADKELRMLRDGQTFDSSGAVVSKYGEGHKSRSMFGAMQASGATFGLKDKAPDIAKPEKYDKPAEIPTAPDMKGWTADTFGIALRGPEGAAYASKVEEYYRENPDFAQNINDEKLREINAARTTHGLPPLVKTDGARHATSSDIRLKRDVQFKGVVNDVRIYSYRYLWSDQVYVGVMAQDLIESHPEALHKDMFGYYHVDYSKLGLRLMTYEEWMRSEAGLLTRQQEK